MGSSAQRMKADGKRAGKKGTLPAGEQFVKMINAFRREPAWLALSFGARCLYIEMKALYNGHNNNGRIMCSARFGAKALGCNKDSVTAYLRELQDKGFIVETRGGSLGSEGKGQGRLWRLTEVGCNGEKPTKDYRNWRSKKFKSPSQSFGQGVPKTRTLPKASVREIGTGCPKVSDSNAPKSAQDCPKDWDNLIYQGEGDAPTSNVNGEFLGEPRKFVAVIGGRAVSGGAR